MNEHTSIHPRPQLARDEWTDLCGEWAFAYDDANQGEAEHWFSRTDVFNRTIRVPFPPESMASGIRETSFHPVVWYRRTFTVEEAQRTGCLLLHFGAVDYRARVWVNNQLVVEHEGGHTPFSADITNALVPEAEQVVVVRAEDDPHDLAQPRGKQDWLLEPHAIWYHRTTGIWQPVWLESLPALFITELRWTPDPERGRFGVKVRLNAVPQHPLRLRVQLFAQGTAFSEDTYLFEGREVSRTIELDPIRFHAQRSNLLWSPSRPNLLDATLSLIDADGQTTDVVHSYVGLRSAGVRDGRFVLNGMPYYLRLVLGQNYWPESHLAAPSADALRREVELIKELGFNGVRIHQKVEDPRFLYWCDRLGLLVWGEMANAYVFTEQSQERLCREWIEVVKRDINHPCIVTWVPINESWGVPNLEGERAQRAFVQSMYYLTKSLDPTRPVIGNDGWELIAGDVLGIHDYAINGDTLRERYGSAEALEQTLKNVQPSRRNFYLAGHQRTGEPVLLTEFGGLSYAPQETERWWGYGTLSNTEALLERYEDLVSAVLDSPIIAGFCYTQLTDTEQETNGLLRADRTPKLDPARIKAINTRVSRAIPADLIAEIHAAAAKRHQQLQSASASTTADSDENT